VDTIELFMQIVLSAATSIRGAAATLGLLEGRLPSLGQAPCPNSGRLWLLRIGLFRLTCRKRKADDWVWMIDHTLQLGPYKCLVMIGIRLSAWDRSRPLKHEDMTLLNLTPMEQSSGERVQEQLEAVVRTTGVPRAVVSDQGTDLKRAMQLFQKVHPQVRHQHDMKHKNALLLKKELERDRRWGEFVKQANRTKLATTQTALAFLNPPGLKIKARYMNLDTLVGWGKRALAYLEQPDHPPDLPVDRRKLKEKLGWLQSYRAALERWSELLWIARTAEKLVSSGVHRSICEELRDQLQASVTTPAGRRMSRAVLAFLGEQSAGMAADERLIGSTEVLESIIGKYKRVQSSYSKGGMTAMLLSIGAMLGKLTPDIIKRGLETVRTNDVDRWCNRHLGTTLQSQRRLLLGATKMG
jgi:hypothetical protein